MKTLKHTQYTLLLTLLCSTALTFAQDTKDWPIINDESVDAILAENQAEWDENIPDFGMRMFYTDEQWDDVAVKLANNEGLRPQIREALFSRTSELLTHSPKEYRTVEEFAAERGITIFAAEEELWQRRVGDDIFALAIAAKLSDHPAYQDKLKEYVLKACEYPTWGRRDRNKGLAASHMVRGISLSYDWHRDMFSLEEQKLIEETIEQRANDIMKGLYGEIYWANVYVQNHNHIPVSALGMAGLAFYHEIPDAPRWLAAAEANFDNVVKYSPTDGSSVEGIPYWSYGHTFILEYIEATRQYTNSGELYEEPFLKNTSAYRIGSSTPGYDGVVPWGDSVERDFVGPHHLLAHTATEYNDTAAQYLVENLPYDPRGARDIAAIYLLWYDPSIDTTPPESLDYHATDWDMVTTRDTWDAEGYMLSIKSGFNNRPHTHLDAGALVLAVGSDWLLQASGYGSGTGNPSFWITNGPRWTFFSNSTESHSTLLINDKNQSYDFDARATIDAYFSTDRYNWTSIDLTDAYRNGYDIRRSVFHRRGDYILVFDSVQGPDAAKVEWLAQVPGGNLATAPRSVTSNGTTGQLHINLVNDEAGDFQRREPTSEHVDEPYDKTMQTWSSVQNGSSVGFLTLLQPVIFSAPYQQVLSFEGDYDGDGNGYASVSTEDWTDSIYVSATPQRIQWAQDETSANQITLTAPFAVIRSQYDMFNELFTTAALQLNISGLTLQSNTPFTLEIGEDEDTLAWVIELATPFEGSLSIPKEMALTDASGKPISSAQTTTLPAGVYTLNR